MSMSGSPSLAQPIAAPSPRRTYPFPPSGPSSPRANRPSIASRLPSISANQPLDFDDIRAAQSSSSSTVVLGFSPPTLAAALPGVISPRPQQLSLHSTNHAFSRLSPQVTTPVEQTFQYPFTQNETSPRIPGTSPRGLPDIPPRSRRNSAAIVSISLSSRSRSRTPRGGATALPGGSSGHGTPSKGSSTVTPRGEDIKEQNVVQMIGNVTGNGAWAPGFDDFEDDWQPAGGMLLHASDEEAVQDDIEEEEPDANGRTWTGLSDASRVVEHVLKPGMLFGEGLEFQGDTVVPAVGRMQDGDIGLPLRRGGSEVGKANRVGGRMVIPEREKKVYEVVRQLGSGSYAVVYLVRERGGQKREFGEHLLHG
jgi:hypothetical protein